MKIFRLLLNIVVLAAIIGGGYYYRTDIINFADKEINYLRPCSRPVTYSFATIDKRFGISKQKFIDDTSKAVDMWETPFDKKLFEYKADGTGLVKINLIYDTRQNSTDQLQKIDTVLNGGKAQYEALRNQYTVLLASYNEKSAALNSDIDDYNARKKAFDEQVLTWNRKGGAPPSEYAQLQKDKADLDYRYSSIQKEQTDLKSQSDSVNGLVAQLNQMASNLNINVDKYNNVNSTLDKEFEEGEYATSQTGTYINIYQFDNDNKLIRVLAHELGHSLGLGHVDNPDAIMYRINQGIDENLSSADIDALKTLCKI